MMEDIDEFSKKVALQITESFPQWENLIEVREHFGEKAIMIKVVSPAKEENTLSIDSFRGEVTVCFDAYD